MPATARSLVMLGQHRRDTGTNGPGVQPSAPEVRVDERADPLGLAAPVALRSSKAVANPSAPVTLNQMKAIYRLAKTSGIYNRAVTARLLAGVRGRHRRQGTCRDAMERH